MDGSSGSGVGGGCAAAFVKAESQTLAMFIMLDQSKSMDNIVDNATMTSRWGAVTSALKTFVSNPVAATIPVGLQYFGLGSAQTTPGIGNPGQGVSCTVSDYAKAEVPIAPLSTNASLITASMAQHAPSSNTPTLPAVEGGVQFVANYASAHPENKVVLVLATDGEPSGCNSTLQNVSAAAAAGLAGTPSVETYVIGVGDNLTNLDAIAVAGGTKHAFLIGDANVQQELLTALTTIQGDVLPCQYSVPAAEMGNTLDFGKVNVRFTPGSGGGTQQEFQKVASASACTAGSNNLWYYDNEAAPTQILLCPDTCSKIAADGTARVDIVLDCKHTVEPPK
ncbi:MAG TPA: vWA domain-containing protein [Polyangiaceae bacterium]|nr:vWA domain-containing protein [Polyangiaceae bacterium]